jgi:hypothetical protein
MEPNLTRPPLLLHIVSLKLDVGFLGECTHSLFKHSIVKNICMKRSGDLYHIFIYSVFSLTSFLSTGYPRCDVKT